MQINCASPTRRKRRIVVEAAIDNLRYSGETKEVTIQIGTYEVVLSPIEQERMAYFANLGRSVA